MFKYKINPNIKGNPKAKVDPHGDVIKVHVYNSVNPAAIIHFIVLFDLFFLYKYIDVIYTMIPIDIRVNFIFKH